MDKDCPKEGEWGVFTAYVWYMSIEAIISLLLCSPPLTHLSRECVYCSKGTQIKGGITLQYLCSTCTVCSINLHVLIFILRGDTLVSVTLWCKYCELPEQTHMHIPCCGGGEQLKEVGVFVLLRLSHYPFHCLWLFLLYTARKDQWLQSALIPATDILILAVTIHRKPDDVGEGQPRWFMTQEQPVTCGGTDNNLLTESCCWEFTKR